MAGPEHLEVGPAAPSGYRRWLVLGAVVLVLAGLGVFRAVGPGPAPGPEPTRPPAGPTGSSSTAEPWPVGAGLPPGTLYVLAGGGLFTVDVGTGLVTRIQVRLDGSGTALTPMAGGVLVWSSTGSGRPALLVDGSSDAREPGGGVRGATTFLTGPDARVWAAKVDLRDPAPRSTWRLVDDEGSVTGRVQVRGFAVGDGAGGLFGVEGATLRHVFPAPTQRWRDTDLLATGRDGYELLSCGRGRCSAELHDRATGTVAPVSPVDLVGVPGALSPGNRFVASVAQGPDEADEVRVTEAGSGALRRSFPSGSYATTFTWLSDRWFVSTSELGLVLYDAVDDVLLHPVLPVDEMEQLVWQPT